MRKEIAREEKKKRASRKYQAQTRDQDRENKYD